MIDQAISNVYDLERKLQRFEIHIKIDFKLVLFMSDLCVYTLFLSYGCLKLEILSFMAVFLCGRNLLYLKVC